MAISDVSVLVPAYKPDARLIAFLRGLIEHGFCNLIVVDDGGGADFAPLFAEAADLGATVLTHAVNRGKGAALKTGLRHLIGIGATPVVTADADGQHAPHDVRRIAEAILENPDSLVLGTRDKKQMPGRSKAGNTITCTVLGVLTGLWIEDTQTGLRALPRESLDDFLSLDGERYEYEMNVLIKAEQLNMPVVQVIIETIYEEGNASSHFKTFRDSFRIYKCLFQQIAKYCGATAMASLVDYAIFLTLHLLFPGDGYLFMCMGVARVVSSLVSYIVNREVVFKSRAGKRSILYFYALVALVFVGNFTLTRLLLELRVPAFVGQPLSGMLLFIVSYNTQQRFIFRDSIHKQE